MKFILAAFHEVNVISKTKIINWPNIYGGVEVLEGLVHDVLEEYVEENRREWTPMTSSYIYTEKLLI